MLLILLLLLSTTLQQPCTSPVVSPAIKSVQIVTAPLNGICIIDSAVSDQINLQPTELGGLDKFTIVLWFRPIKGPSYAEQAIFRVSADTSDVTLATVNGVRLGMYVTVDNTQLTQISIKYAKSSTNAQAFIQGFTYTDTKWCFAVAGLSYPNGKVFYYAWQPSQPSLQVNPQPVTEANNFHTALPTNAVLQLMYWGDTYKRFCGEINGVTLYSNYMELDYKHNWLHLAILSPTYSTSIIAQYRLEEGVGQSIYDKKSTAFGTLGLTTAVEAAADPVWSTGFMLFNGGQFAVIPAMVFGTTNTVYGVSFWFKCDATITGDGDSTDLVKDLVVMKRRYQGTIEVFGILFYTATGTQYGTKLKINGVMHTPAAIVHTKNMWHYMTVLLIYPNGVLELNKIMYDIAIEGSVFQAHQATSLSNAYQESATDTVTLGDSANGYTNQLRLSNINFFNSYTLYVDEDNTDTIQLKCHTSNECQMSLNTLTQSYCLFCKTNKQDDGDCKVTCNSGPNALSNVLATNSGIQVCRSCDYRCSTCQTNGNCNTCGTGYFMQSNLIVCDTSANCGGGMVGNPTTKLCTLCGNAIRAGAEACDDGDFIDNNGCTNCIVDTTPVPYICSGITPDVCVLKCSNGKVEVPETCDDGNLVNGDGCSATCTVESTTHSCVNHVGAPYPESVCTKLCGNGTRLGTEQCDDGNQVNGDGCSDQCVIEVGYECNTAVPNVCNKLCGNGVLNFGEECEDGNVINNDGCSDCVIDSGWVCTGAVCSKICGNGVRESSEECDDGNTIGNDGCTNCKVDIDYLCTGGSSTTQDKCKVVPDVCGDSIKKSSEECDDGNSTSNDGCSSSCKVEIGYYCQGGSTSSKDTCYAICGDGKKLSIEQCDDGNTFGGDGCDEYCKLEQLYYCSGGSLTKQDSCYIRCGDGNRDDMEQCDDDNDYNNDGCSSRCQIEPGYGCISQPQSHDLCFKCIDNCSKCINSSQCITCYSGFYQLQGKCYPGCPFGFRAEQQQCKQCDENCDKCTVDGCIRCNYNHYVNKGKCYEQCPDGYYNEPNAIMGNQCIQCTAPCIKCSSSDCYACGNTFYLLDSVCVSCGMGAQCLRCDHADGKCLECDSGYYRDGQQCTVMPVVCGDGLHHPQERCDDGNLDTLDGCDIECKVEEGWDCILYDSQGPDVCFTRAPPKVTMLLSDVYFNRLYVHFARPMQENIPFSNLTTVNIPDLDDTLFVSEEPVNDEGVVITHSKENAFIPYQYTVQQVSNQTVMIDFTFQVTVQDMTAIVTFNNASTIVDIYKWSLSPTQTRLLQEDAVIPTDQVQYESKLSYYIHYEDLDKTISSLAGWLILVIGCLGTLSSLLYIYLIGEGRIRKTVEYLQIVAMFRFLNLRMGLNMEEVLIKMDYFNITWMFNVFNLIDQSVEQAAVQSKFQIHSYNSQFLHEGGGRFLTVLGVVLILLGINELLYRLFKVQLLEYYTEQIHKYFKYQGFILLIEIFYMDLMLSIVLQFSNTDFDNWFSIVSFTLALLILITFMVFGGLIVKYIVINPKSARITSCYELYGELYDGILFTNIATKAYALVPYLYKLIIAIVLVCLTDPLIQIILIVFFRLFFYSFSSDVLPIYYLELFIRDVAYDLSVIVVALVMLAFQDSSSDKQAKQDAGWGIIAIIFLTMVLQMLWVRYAYQIIDRMLPPDVPDHEEVRDEEEHPDQKKKVHILQQAVEMQHLEHDFFGQ